MDLNSEKDLLGFCAILSVIFLFFLYYYLSGKRVLSDLILKISSGSADAESVKFASDKFTGLILFGIIPYIVFIVILKIAPSDIGFRTGDLSKAGYAVAALFLLIPAVTFFTARNPAIWRISPELRTETWKVRHVVIVIFCWISYLTGYEFFFRGVLWFLCYNAFGFWGALAVNIFLYSLVHIPKGKFQTLGAIPMGVIFCLLSHFTGSFFPALLLHCTMALSAEFFSFYHNPGFRFQKTF